MADKEDWLLRPITRGFCSYVELKLTNLDLHDFAVMNDAIDVEENNRKRINEATK